MVSTPSYDPNALATHDFGSAKRVLRATGSSATDKLHAQPRAPSSSTRRARPSSSSPPPPRSATATPPTPLVKGGSSSTCRRPSDDLHNENGCELRRRQDHPDRRPRASRATSPSRDLGLELGADALREQAEKFGFNEDVHRRAPAQRQPASSRPTLDEPQTALSAIGQYDVAASPLQMAMVAAGIANGGEVMKPYIVQEVRSPDLDVLDEADPEVLHQAISSDVAAELTQMMVDVVENGTGSNAQIRGRQRRRQDRYRELRRPTRPPYAWMVTFAPADDPQVAVAVFIESTDITARRHQRQRPRRPDRQGRHGGGDRPMTQTQRDERVRRRDAAAQATDERKGRPDEHGAHHDRRRPLRAGRPARPRRHGRGAPRPRPPARPHRRHQAAAHRPRQRPDVPGPVPARGAVGRVAQPSRPSSPSTTPARSSPPTAAA